MHRAWSWQTQSISFRWIIITNPTRHLRLSLALTFLIFSLSFSLILSEILSVARYSIFLKSSFAWEFHIMCEKRLNSTNTLYKMTVNHQMWKKSTNSIRHIMHWKWHAHAFTTKYNVFVSVQICIVSFDFFIDLFYALEFLSHCK